MDSCSLTDVIIGTDTANLEESSTGKLIGMSANCQVVDSEGNVVDITDRDLESLHVNSSTDVRILDSDGSEVEDAVIVGSVLID